MNHSERGYITFLLLAVTALSFFLAGGFTVLQQSPITTPSQQYLFQNPSVSLHANTLQLENLGFVPSSCDPGYLLSGEPNILWAAFPGPTQTATAADKIKLFYSDEHALTLGTGTVSPMTTHPTDSITSPAINVGDTVARDTYGFPYFPALFLTDITFDPNSTTGDVNHGGTPSVPTAVYGTWKAANGNDPSPNNNWILPAGADTFPTQPTIPHSVVKKETKFSAEIEWNISTLNLTVGHTYRVQFVVHDGDNNKTGGDIGIGCTTIQM
ncbi:MAG TPA: hypothetical protein VGT05_02995 [Patescibacteria group bacterium]|nr:hypothetical protein [Patescibacteria group bacterium]